MKVPESPGIWVEKTTMDKIYLVVKRKTKIEGGAYKATYGLMNELCFHPSLK